LKLQSKFKPKLFDGVKIQNSKLQLTVAGFSLIEVLIAMAIFMFIIGGVVMFSVNSIKANTRSQAMQGALDNARFTMDDLAKRIRTSSNVEITDEGIPGSGKSLFFIDNRTVNKYCYKFDGVKMVAKEIKSNVDGGTTSQEATDYNNIKNCDDFNSNDFEPVVGGAGEKVTVDGKFEVMKTDIDGNDPHRGFVRIVIDILYNENGSPENRAEMHLQSGVSIADYNREDGFELDVTSL